MVGSIEFDDSMGMLEFDDEQMEYYWRSSVDPSTRKGCVDQLFVVMQLSEKFLAKGRDLFLAFMDLEKAHERVDMETL